MSKQKTPKPKPKTIKETIALFYEAHFFEHKTRPVDRLLGYFGSGIKLTNVELSTYKGTFIADGLSYSQAVLNCIRKHNKC